MRIRLPDRPAGNNAAVKFMQWVWDRLARELQFIDTPTIRWERKTNGLAAHSITRSAQSAPSEGMRFRGTWISTEEYRQGDVVATGEINATGLDGPYHFWVWFGDTSDSTPNPEECDPVSSYPMSLENSWVPFSRVPWVSQININPPPTVSIAVNTPTGTKTLHFTEGVLAAVT